MKKIFLLAALSMLTVHLFAAPEFDLYMACLEKDEYKVEMLLKQGINPNAKLTKQEYAQLAEEFIRVSKIEFSTDKKKLDYISNWQRYPLHLAADNGNTEVVKLLLAASADVDVKDEGERTPLRYAAENGHTETVKLLLAANADVNTTDFNGNTPLIYAAENGHTETVKLLLAANADVNAKDEYERTPLMHAARNGHSEIVNLLTEALHKNPLSTLDYRKATLDGYEKGTVFKITVYIGSITKNRNDDFETSAYEIRGSADSLYNSNFKLTIMSENRPQFIENDTITLTIEFKGLRDGLNATDVLFDLIEINEVVNK